jgi:enoyl-CoA hydratase/carnithine racemase
VIVLTGAGRGFCAGADMSLLSSIASHGITERERVLQNTATNGSREGVRPDFQKKYSYFPSIQKPVIAAVNGPAVGLGLIIALYCDMRFATEEARFGTAFARRGLIAEYGISWILPRVVGWGPALDLLLSGRVFYADEAAELGLVKEVVAPDELLPRAIAYAEDIAANCAPSSLAVIKQQVYADTMRDVFEASDRAEKLMHESMQRPDFIEGITSFFEKRPPHFPPLKEEMR